ncbi:MAG: archease [Aquificae bacterium]|nr:archease [Aquificota bacterium]
MKRLNYEPVYDITAEAGIRVRAKTLEELFCSALLATFNEITDIDKVEEKESYEISARNELPFLLADIINEALVLHETKKFVASGCEVLELKENEVRVRLKGERYDPRRHPPKLVIKAATYHRLKIEKKDGYYEAEVIFDI